MKEEWKEWKWFRFILIWYVVYLISSAFLYFVFFDAPPTFNLRFVWNILSAREFMFYSFLWAIFMVGNILGVFMLIKEMSKRY